MEQPLPPLAARLQPCRGLSAQGRVGGWADWSGEDAQVSMAWPDQAVLLGNSPPSNQAAEGLGLSQVGQRLWA